MTVWTEAVCRYMTAEWAFGTLAHGAEKRNRRNQSRCSKCMVLWTCVIPHLPQAGIFSFRNLFALPKPLLPLRGFDGNVFSCHARLGSTRAVRLLAVAISSHASEDAVKQVDAAKTVRARRKKRRRFDRHRFASALRRRDYASSVPTRLAESGRCWWSCGLARQHAATIPRCAGQCSSVSSGRPASRIAKAK